VPCDAAYRLFFEHVVSAMNYSPISVAVLNAATNDTISPF
jgi:hypothetical protein